MTTYLRRVSERVAESVLADPDRIRKVLFPSSTETVIDDEVLVTIDGLEYWEEELLPDARVTKLGTPVGTVDIGGSGPARALRPADVRKLATQLAVHHDTKSLVIQLSKGFSAPPGAPSIDEVAEGFERLKEFVTETAKAEAALLVYQG